ncbi:MAG: hypothetical protein HPY85_01585 [Anaerolineae bacterium]|nr:hypothetical protein [Anaerolineae bacterium]
MTITFHIREIVTELDLGLDHLPLKRALEELGLSSQAYLAVRSGELLTEGDILHTGDVVQLIPVISGGSQ